MYVNINKLAGNNNLYNSLGCDLLKYILASMSDRRKELLSRLISDFDIINSNFDERTIKMTSTIEDYVTQIAYGKAKSVSGIVSDDSIIIAADTVVSIKGEILGKPKDKTEAFNMLKKLSGNWHEVYTSLVVINNLTNDIKKDVAKTRVKFSELTDQEIIKYIDSNEPFDKAGAYGIQGLGGTFVEKIDGCFYNVVGLSINRLRVILKEIV